MAINRFIKIAIAEAKKSTYLYRLGAIALKGNNIVSKGHNRHNVNNFLHRRYGFRATHAEAITILRSNYHSADTLIVVRILRDGKITCSYPCKKCQMMLKDSTIKNIWYTDWNGNIQSMKI